MEDTTSLNGQTYNKSDNHRQLELELSTPELQQIDIPDSDKFNKTTIWDEKKLAELVGYQGLSTENFIQSPIPHEESQTPIESVENSNPELSQSELFDEPIKNRTKPSLASNPFAKLGTVGISMAVIFGLGGLLFTLTTLTNSKPKPKPQTSAVNQINGTKTDQNPNGELKTQIALDKQAQMIKQYGNTPTTAPTPNVQQKPLPAQTQPTPSPTPTPPSPAAVSRPVPPPVMARYIPPTPVSPHIPLRTVQPTRLVAQRVQLAPATVTPRISNPPQLVAATPRVPQQIQRIAPTPSNTQPQQTPAPNLDPQGSYGQVSLAYLQQAYSTSSQETATSQPSTSVSSTIPRVVPMDTGSMQNTNPLPIQSGVATAEENSIINRVPLLTLQVGESAPGVLVNPVVSSGQASNQSFLIKLSQPLLDMDNTEVLPAGTSIVVSVNSVLEGGLTNLVAQRVIIGNNEYILPANVISIRGADQKPLMAKRINKDTSLGLNLGAAFWGALANVGQVLTRADSTTSISTGTYSSSTSSGGKDVFGAVLQGGANPLLTQAQNQSQYQQQNHTTQTPVWFMASGTPVVVFVNQTFEF